MESTLLKNFIKSKLNDEHSRIVLNQIIFIKEILQWIPRSIPNHTDHGLLHATNVMTNIMKFDNNYVDFSEREKFILLLASIFHDIGCIINRKNHHFNSLEILERDEFKEFRDLLNEEEYISLQQVIVSHSRSYNLNIVIENPAEDIRLDLICPLFRLADSLDVGSSRIDMLVFKILRDYNLLNEKSNKIWESHTSILEVNIKKQEIIIETRDIFLNEYCLMNIIEEVDPINIYLEKKGYKKFHVKFVYKGQDLMDPSKYLTKHEVEDYKTLE